MIKVTRRSVRDMVVYTAIYCGNRDKSISEIIHQLLKYLKDKFATDDKLIEYIDNGLYDAGEYKKEIFVQVTV